MISGTCVGGVNSGPRPPARVFPGAGPLPDVRPEHRVQLHYDRDDDRLVGTVGDEPVEWHPVRHKRVSGRLGASFLEASWTTGDNYVPGPGGWVPRPDYVSDFPNIPADLMGSFAGSHAELHGVFHLGPNYAFERGSIVGQMGAVHLEATVLAASGGLCDTRTVVAEGTYGSVPLLVCATIDAGLSRGMLRGSVGGALVHIDLTRSAIRRPVRPGGPHLDFPGPQTDLSGSYDGPPELLAVMVGAMLKFL